MPPENDNKVRGIVSAYSARLSGYAGALVNYCSCSTFGHSKSRNKWPLNGMAYTTYRNSGYALAFNRITLGMVVL